MTTAIKTKRTLDPPYLKVVIRPSTPSEQTEGGIYLPEQSREKSVEGTVLAVGPGKYRQDGGFQSPTVAVGDTVLYTKYGGVLVDFDGEELLIMDDDLILAIIRSREEP